MSEEYNIADVDVIHTCGSCDGDGAQHRGMVDGECPSDGGVSNDVNV